MNFLAALVLVTQAQGDGFPSRASTPEGVACDLARAFMNLDSKLFQSSCLAMPIRGKSGEEYNDFLLGVSSKLDLDRKTEAIPRDIPKQIKKVWKSRHLSREGPASTAYALYQLKDVMFVDVETELNSGEIFKCRTLVFQLADKSWRALPRPDLYPLLSTGLNDEPASKEEIPRK